MKKKELFNLIKQPDILKRTLRFGKDVSDQSITELLEKILKLFQESPNEFIVLHLTTGGGAFAQAVSYYEIIRMYAPKLITIASGRCCSSGIPMLLASEPELRFAARQTNFLIHLASVKLSNNINMTNLEEEKDYLLQLGEMDTDIVLAETKLSKKEYNKIVTNELFSEVEDVKKWGFISEIL